MSIPLASVSDVAGLNRTSGDANGSLGLTAWINSTSSQCHGVSLAIVAQISTRSVGVCACLSRWNCYETMDDAPELVDYPDRRRGMDSTVGRVAILSNLLQVIAKRLVERASPMRCKHHHVHREKDFLSCLSNRGWFVGPVFHLHMTRDRHHFIQSHRLKLTFGCSMVELPRHHGL